MGEGGVKLCTHILGTMVQAHPVTKARTRINKVQPWGLGGGGREAPGAPPTATFSATRSGPPPGQTILSNHPYVRPSMSQAGPCAATGGSDRPCKAVVAGVMPPRVPSGQCQALGDHSGSADVLI